MTAQSAARVPVEIEGRDTEAPMKGSTTIWQGSLVVMESGLAVPGKVATGLIVLGIAQKTVVNAGADSAEKVVATRGVFKFFNYGSDAVVAADLGKDCYIYDDQTVAKTSGSNARSIAGKVIRLDSDGVFVRVGY